MLVELAKLIPGVSEPKTYLSFRTRLKYTFVILLLFLVMSQITVYGISEVSREHFQFLEMVLGSRMGSLMTLGIGPIVMASILLQLLVGSGIIPWDLKKIEERKKFQAMQKLLTIFFCVFEASAFVLFGTIQPRSPDYTFIVLFQLFLGGFLVLLMDEVVSKWGIGSGVSLFIAAGVATTIFVGAFNPCAIGETGCTMPDINAGIFPFGKFMQFVSFLQIGDLLQSILSIIPIIATILVFFIVVYAQSIRVEIPLAFATIRGFARRWPLRFIYTSNIPVILIAALLANLQLLAHMLYSKGIKFLGAYDEQGNIIGGLLYYITPPTSSAIHVFSVVFLLVIFVFLLLFYFKKLRIKHGFLIALIIAFVLGYYSSYSTVGLPTGTEFIRFIGYMLFMTIGSMIFSIFWVITSGMDSKSVAEQIQSIGMQIPGFRRDPRIIEAVLDRYIPSLAILGGLFVGFLAAIADLTGALGTGTGILLTVMIIYNFYEQISMQYLEDMHPAFRKFFER